MTESSSRPPVPLRLKRLPGRFAIARLGPDDTGPDDTGSDDTVPDWARQTKCEFLSITRTADELSIIAPAEVVPKDVTAERDFVALRIVGTLEFSAIGILSRLTTALADAGISVFAISTYDTDYLLVRFADQARAEHALNAVATVSQ